MTYGENESHSLAMAKKAIHRVLQHRDDQSRRTIMADHGARDVPRGTLRRIIDQAGLTVDEFIGLLCQIALPALARCAPEAAALS